MWKGKKSRRSPGTWGKQAAPVGCYRLQEPAPEGQKLVSVGLLIPEPVSVGLLVPEPVSVGLLVPEQPQPERTRGRPRKLNVPGARLVGG